jgi:hypothetical protein
MYYCRKFFATYYRFKGIGPEITDLLQGRISNSVFGYHHYKTNINETVTNRIRPLLDSLIRELS